MTSAFTHAAARAALCALVLASSFALAHQEPRSPYPWENGDRYNNTFAKDFVMDAPWRVIDADTPIPLTIILKDCDVDDIRELHWIRCWDVTGGGSTILWNHDYGDEEIGDDASEDDYWTWITTVTEGHPSLPNGTLLTPAHLGYAAGDAIQLEVSIHYRDDWFNYTETRRLRVHVGSGPFPWPAGWYGGDVHYHTMYTNNIAEHGAPLPAVAMSAEAMGLHWLCATDHSCDIDETGDGAYSYATLAWEYTLQTPGGISTVYRDVAGIGGTWNALQSDVALLSSPAMRLYRGVEINLASIDADSYDRTLHCLFYNPSYIHSPWCGAIGERPVYPSLPDGLAQLDPEGFAYAAHPVSDLGGEWGGINWTVNGSVWGDEDLALSMTYDAFAGVQIFNTRATLQSNDQDDPWGDFDAGNPYTGADAYPDELLVGLGIWDGLLRDGLAADPPRKVFLAGGSDAHGDLNYATYLSLDDYATDNAIGKVQTVAYVPGPYAPGDLPPTAEIMAAYRAGRSTATDGPFLEIGLDRDDDGDWYEEGDLVHGGDGFAAAGVPLPLKIRWASLPEFGPIVSVRLFAASAAGSQEILSFDPDASGQGYGGETSLDLAGMGFIGWRALRAECLTADGHAGHRAYTNPIWLEFEDPTAVADAPIGAPRLLGSHPNPFNPSTTIRFSLPSAARVELRIFAADGRLARTLIAGETFPAGEHAYRWDGLDDGGDELPSGVYLCRLASGAFTESAKLLLLK